MIEIQEENGKTTRLIVKANQSMSWRANMYLAASLGFICMGIAVAMATFGLWMVIPFAGAEIILIVVCLYLTLKRLSRKEVITLNNEAIRLEFSRLSYHCTDNVFEVGELSVSAHGKRYALGRSLNREEKKELYTELKSALNDY